MAKSNLSIVGAPATKKKKVAARRKSTIRPRSPIYTALVEFVQNERAATVCLYILGTIKGAFFPLCAFVTAHAIVWQLSWHTAAQVTLTAFCLAFSVPTALQFGQVAFGGLKGYGFAIGLELAMLVSTRKLSLVAAGLLVVINILAAFYNMRSGKQFSELAAK